MLKFPDFALKCIELLETNGFEAYFVGGCVRDGLLDRPCDDFDITTSATPDEIASVFENTIPTGIKHGTVTVLIDGHTIEVTTYRSDGVYLDGRHPKNVSFEKNIESDLERRDFTINALAYNPKKGLVDLFGGVEDLKNKTIRTVGDPDKRFSEDALRIMRAFRFASTLGFSINKESKSSAIKLKSNLSLVSGERIYAELLKALNGKHPERFIPLIESNALNTFGIEKCLCPHNALSMVPDLPFSAREKLALFVSICNHNIDLIKQRLKPDNDFLSILYGIDNFSTESFPQTKVELKKAMKSFGVRETVLGVHRFGMLSGIEVKAQSLLINEILANREPFSIAHLAVSGDDVKMLGFSGKQIGEALDKLLEAVISDPTLNQKHTLLRLLQKQ